MKEYLKKIYIAIGAASGAITVDSWVRKLNNPDKYSELKKDLMGFRAEVEANH